jgi:hypothetical protein
MRLIGFLQAHSSIRKEYQQTIDGLTKNNSQLFNRVGFIAITITI